MENVAGTLHELSYYQPNLEDQKGKRVTRRLVIAVLNLAGWQKAGWLRKPNSKVKKNLLF
jgi:hypothetical protein